MAIRTVITRGFGEGATIPEVATRGFISDGGSPPTPPAIKYPTIGNGVGVSVSIRMGTR